MEISNTRRNQSAHYFVLLILIFYIIPVILFMSRFVMSSRTNTTICKNTVDNQLIKKLNNTNINIKFNKFSQTIQAKNQIGYNVISVAGP